LGDDDDIVIVMFVMTMMLTTMMLMVCYAMSVQVAYCMSFGEQRWNCLYWLSCQWFCPFSWLL